MPENNEDIVCVKCGAKMERVRPSPPRSLDMYSGSTNITHSSVATSVTFNPSSGTNTNADSSTNYPIDYSEFRGSPIKIVSFVCPESNWTKQIRE